jgi:type IV fimbrial biogenesis protein FimT
MRHTPCPESRGITLPELCLSLALLALLAGMSVPGFRASQRNAAVRAATFDLLAGLQQSRAGSILESRPGVFCIADAQGSCLSAARPGTAWRSFLETGARRDEQGGQSLPPGIEVRATRSPLRFWPDSSSASTGTLTICDSQGLALPRAIVISQGGRARLDTPPRDACNA